MSCNIRAMTAVLYVRVIEVLEQVVSVDQSTKYTYSMI